MKKTLPFWAAAFVVAMLSSCITGIAPITLTKKDLDRSLALTLIDASNQTYRAYSGKPVVAPSGWTYTNETFSGDDFFLKSRTKRLFGVIFDKTDSPGTVLYAFRGTDNAEEWWDDLQITPTSFTPSSASVELPADLKVEKGFDLVYQSMKAQLLRSVDAHKAKRVFVTGHSLGAALSELFVFDLSLSRPELEIYSYNYASPRVGNATYVKTYTALAGQRTRPTVRIANVQDIVPKVPLQFDGYVHTPTVFNVDFKEVSGLPNFLIRHSSDNYLRTLKTVLEMDSYDGALVNDKLDQFEIVQQE